MSENSAPGEKPKFVGILYVLLKDFAFISTKKTTNIFSEQRVSALLMSILTGLSVFFTQVLGVCMMNIF